MAKKIHPGITNNDVLSILHTEPDGVRISELEEAMLLGRRDRQAIKKTLDNLIARGLVARTKAGRFVVIKVPKETSEAPPPEAAPGVVGSIRVTPGGVGFVTRDDGEDDVFIGGERLAGAMDMDRVEVKVWRGSRGPEGEVIRVVARGRIKLTGVIVEKAGRLRFESDDPRILHPIRLAEKPGRDALGKVVLAAVTAYPTYNQAPIEVAVEKILGEPGILTTEVEKTIVVSGIEEAFPKEVLDEMERVVDHVTPAEQLGRTDFRNTPLITIDPKDARDFDDAVYVEKVGQGYTLTVAIADVSHYVVEGSAVDHEARNRGLSIYLPDRAIPMLPPVLSSEMCSLKPDVERLAMVAVIQFDGQGKRLGYTLHPGLIRSHGRLNYEEVAKVLQGKSPDHPKIDQIGLLKEFSDVLHTVRRARGSLELDLPEAKVLLDEDDPLRIRDIIQAKPDEWVKAAYGLVEECMLAANEAVGDFMETHKIPVPWRIHEEPDPERLEHFGNFAAVMGIDVGDSLTRGGRINSAFDKMASHEASRTLFYGLLRSMKQAQYSQDNKGHYALAAPTYLHFTSPIRRYPDLAVHRALKAWWGKEGRILGEEKKHTIPSMDEAKEVSTFASGFEKRGVEVERKINDIYRAWFMVPKVGQLYTGTIISITGFGMFVSLDHPFVEGMVRLEWIEEDHFEFVEELGILRGVKSGKSLFPGDKLNIIVAKADVPRGQISFEPDGTVFEHIPMRQLPAGLESRPAGRSKRPERDPNERSRRENKGLTARRRGQRTANGGKKSATKKGRGRKR